MYINHIINTSVIASIRDSEHRLLILEVDVQLHLHSKITWIKIFSTSYWLDLNFLHIRFSLDFKKFKVWFFLLGFQNFSTIVWVSEILRYSVRQTQRTNEGPKTNENSFPKIKLLVKYISLICTPIITDVGCKERQINISHKQYIITLTEFDSRSFISLTKSCCHRELTVCTYCWVLFTYSLKLFILNYDM